MITSLDEFVESTAFERLALSALVPLPRVRPDSSVMDIATRNVTIGVAPVEVRVFAGGVRELHIELRPLAFGAAWKVLDLLLELAYSNANLSPRRGSEWTIAEKANLARRGRGVCEPVSRHESLWSALLATYAGTEEIRHSLVHREARVGKDGTMTGSARGGRELTPIGPEEQEAFCRATLRAATAAISGRWSPREFSDAAWQLNQLHSHHGQPALPGSELRPPPLVVAPNDVKDGYIELDVPALLEKARATWSTLEQFDIAVDLPDGRRLIGELENCPRKILAVNAALPPDWLREESRGAE